MRWKIASLIGAVTLFLLLCIATAHASGPVEYSLSSSYTTYDNVGTATITVNAVPSWSGNPLVNPGFESDLSGWTTSTPAGVTIDISTSEHRSGAKSCHIKNTGTNAGSIVSGSNKSYPGEDIQLSGYFKGTTGAGVLYLTVSAYNGVGAFISNPVSIAITGDPSTWTQFSGHAIMPAGTATIIVGVTTYGVEEIYVDDLALSSLTTFTGSVNYATSDGTATAGYDYTSTSGTLTFNDADTSKTFNVPITNRGAYYGNRAFTITISSPVNGTLGTSTATATIVDTHTQSTAVGSGYRYLYVSNWDAQSVSVIDPNIPAKITEIKTRPKPLDVVVNPSGSTLYVTYSQATASGTYVDVFNTVDYSLITSILVSSNTTSQYCGVTINDDGTRLFVGLYGDNKVVAINTITNTIVGQVTIPFPNYGIEYYNGYLYVASYQGFDYSSGTVWKIDTHTMSIISHVANNTVNYPRDLIIDRSRNMIAVLDHNDSITSIPVSTFIASGVATTAPITGPYGLSINGSGWLFAGIFGSITLTD